MDILLLNTHTNHKQPTGGQTKNLGSKMLTICSLLFWGAGSCGTYFVPVHYQALRV